MKKAQKTGTVGVVIAESTVMMGVMWKNECERRAGMNRDAVENLSG